MEPEFIEVKGARQHNLLGVDVDLPLQQLTVVSGVSGTCTLMTSHVAIRSARVAG